MIQAFAQTPKITGSPADRLVQRNDPQGATQTYYHGIPVKIADDLPYAIDQTTDEANLLSSYQKVWQEGCNLAATPDACRSIMMRLVLRFALTKQLASLGTEEDQWFDQMIANWSRAWPTGLKIPNPNLPNRDPFTDVQSAGTVRSGLGASLPATEAQAAKDSLIPPEFEPLNLRDPLMIWRVSTDDRTDLNGAVIGLSRIFTLADRKILDQRLFEVGHQQTIRHVTATCAKSVEIDGVLKFSCEQPTPSSAIFAGSFLIKGSEVVPNSLILSTSDAGTKTKCSTDPMRVRANPRTCKAVATATLDTVGGNRVITLVPRDSTDGLHFRLGDGNAVDRVVVTWPPGQPAQATVQVDILDDAKILSDLIAKLPQDASTDITSAKPFRRTGVMTTLLAKWGTQIDANDSPLGTIVEVNGAANAQALKNIMSEDARLTPFVTSCKECHSNSIGRPPNWLHAEKADALRKQIFECRQRIYYRVSQWDHLPSKDQVKEMPPRQYVANVTDWDNSRKQIRTYLQNVMGMSADQADRDILSQDYDSFPRCRSEVE